MLYNGLRCLPFLNKIVPQSHQRVNLTSVHEPDLKDDSAAPQHLCWGHLSWQLQSGLVGPNVNRSHRALEPQDFPSLPSPWRTMGHATKFIESLVNEWKFCRLHSDSVLLNKVCVCPVVGP